MRYTEEIIPFLDKYWAFINCIKGDQWLDCFTILGPKRIPYHQLYHTVICEKNTVPTYIQHKHQYYYYLSDLQLDFNKVGVSGEDAKHNDCLDFNNVPIFKAVDILSFALVQCP